MNKRNYLSNSVIEKAKQAGEDMIMKRIEITRKASEAGDKEFEEYLKDIEEGITAADEGKLMELSVVKEKWENERTRTD